MLYECMCVYVYYVCTLFLGKPEKGSRSHETEVTSGKLTHLSWDPGNLTHVPNKSRK